MHRLNIAALSHLPNCTGVYIFYGEGSFPLYIGKSVNIRSRVLSHLRNAEEARLIAQTRHIDFIETAGELGALLLEAHMIKKHSPLKNKRLRRKKSLCSLRLEVTEAGLALQWVNGCDEMLGQDSDLYGLFSSPFAAKEKLRELAQQPMRYAKACWG